MPREERTPLLCEPSHSYSTPPVDRDRSPPPNYNQATSQRQIVICAVCGYQIDITNVHNEYEVTCAKCNEETPIGNPPRGKSYSRCSYNNCNKLLKYPKTATRVSCPRCKEVVDINVANHSRNTQQPDVSIVAPSSSRTSVPSRSTEAMYRFVCGYCNVESVLDVAPGQHFRCRHCGRRSRTNNTNRRAMVFIVLGTVMVVLTLVLMSSTVMLRHNSGYWWIYMILLAVATCFHSYGLWLMCVKKSTVQVVP
ncbi:type 2 phosphatidylinositol 4,5-bisphosphate 4-phosphatase-like isoform X2 [Ornithodoros turicata]|uniref:type 2 phosphatidylinositol 4,5-bisphosphate 4-phosphatase-like isoform X2 n=1 Tax=Ornithodoros turicata TaxID=34597 RepID=UPI003138B952